MSAPDLAVFVNQLEIAREVSSDDVVGAVTATTHVEGVERGEISVTFVELKTIIALNKTHLDRSGPTDVIAFELGAPGEPLGDIYICPEIARESAAEYGVEPRLELLRLVIHGTLHVLGHRHPEGSDREESEMFRKQDAILDSLLGS